MLESHQCPSWWVTCYRIPWSSIVNLNGRLQLKDGSDLHKTAFHFPFTPLDTLVTNAVCVVPVKTWPCQYSYFPGKSSAAEVSPPVRLFYIYFLYLHLLCTLVCLLVWAIFSESPPLHSLIKAMLGRGWSKSPAAWAQISDRWGAPDIQTGDYSSVTLKRFRMADHGHLVIQCNCLISDDYTGSCPPVLCLFNSVCFSVRIFWTR